MKVLATRPSRQRGIVLVVSLILVMVITMVSLASIRGTTMQERMTANLYDREIAFQAAESALRAAEAAISNSPDIDDLGGVDCRPDAPVPVQCDNVPASTWQDDDTNWVNVPNDFRVGGALADGAIAQYHIAWLGQDTGDDTFSLGSSANTAQYGGTGGVPLANFFRVTVRSSNPGALDGRSLVVLQTMVKVNL